MHELINIHSKNHEVLLSSGRYHVDVHGGWKVNRNGFNIELIHKKTQKTIRSERSWPVQNFYGMKRSRRILTFHIPEDGVYIMKFKNSENLIVKESNLPMFGWIRNLLFNGIPDNRTICVFFS